MTKEYEKRFSVSILLWMRKNKPRQEPMEDWTVYRIAGQTLLDLAEQK